MCSPGYHHNDFMTTNALGLIMYGYILYGYICYDYTYCYIHYTHLALVRFEHSLCLGSLMTTYIRLLQQLVEHSLFHWYQQYVTVHYVPKCMSCHKAIVVIIGRAYGFHDCIYITPILYILVFTTEGFLEVAIESWPEWDLNPRPLNSVQTL